MRVPTRSGPEYLSLAFWLPSFPRCHTRLSVVRNGSMSRLGHVDYGNTLFDDAVAASSKRRYIKLTSVHRRLPHQTSAEVCISFCNLCAAKQTLGLHIPALNLAPYITLRECLPPYGQNIPRTNEEPKPRTARNLSPKELQAKEYSKPGLTTNRES